MPLGSAKKFVRYELRVTGKTALSLDYALENRLLEGAKL
jgi:hypothetical protein